MAGYICRMGAAGHGDPHHQQALDGARQNASLSPRRLEAACLHT